MRITAMLVFVSVIVVVGLSGCLNSSKSSTTKRTSDSQVEPNEIASSSNTKTNAEKVSALPSRKMKPVKGQENSSLESKPSVTMPAQHREQTFSFLNPDTYHLADNEQRKILKEIYESEFNLSHLSADEQNVLTEALSKSGIEVQSACVVNKETTAKIGAFFRNWNMIQLTKYHPPTQDHPFSHLVEETEESDKDGQPTTRRSYSQVATDYPYPLSEANAVIKLVPINLSTTRVLERTADSATYEADPSELLFANLSEEDQLWTADDSRVLFNIDLDRNRLNWLKYELKESVKVYNFVRISDFQLNYELVEDEALNRNVVRSVDHSMKGRIALVFRPNLKISNSFSYDTCTVPPPTESYLFRSMSAIANL